MSSDIDILKQQVMDLQSQLAFQEDAIGSLDAALSQQQQEILVLRRQLELFRQQQKEQAERGGTNQSEMLADERPPHY
jgi:SlyX protein